MSESCALHHVGVRLLGFPTVVSECNPQRGERLDAPYLVTLRHFFVGFVPLAWFPPRSYVSDLFDRHLVSPILHHFPVFPDIQ
jgi:hypothetical protein